MSMTKFNEGVVIEKIQAINQAGMNIETILFVLNQRKFAEALEIEGVEFQQSHVYKLMISGLLESVRVINHVVETIEDDLFIDADPKNPGDLEKAYKEVVKNNVFGYHGLPS